MKMNCFDYEVGKDTAGQPMMGRQCYCGTTACGTVQRKIESEKEYDFICECGKHKRKDGKWISYPPPTS